MDNLDEINHKHFSSRSLNKKITDIISKNKINITNNYDLQKELLFFKNDILKDIRDLEAKQTEKLFNYKEEQTKIINSYEARFALQNEKISYLSNMIVEHFRKEKFENYFEEFKKKLEKNFGEMVTKIYSLQGEIKDVLYQQERFFNENVLYPGVIGYQCKFKDFHAFVDYVLESINEIELFQEKIKSYEIHKIRKNLKADLNTIQSRIKTNFNILSKFTTEKVKESEEKMLKVLNAYNSQFVDVRVENNKNADDLRKKMDEVANNFEQIIKIRKEMNQKNQEQDLKLENIIQNIADNENKINEQSKEINNVDKKFNLLTTYIDNQNEENYNDQYNNVNSRNFVSNKYSVPKRIKSARDFINRQMRMMAKGEEYAIDNNINNNIYNNISGKTGFNYRNNFTNNKFDNYNKNLRTLDNNTNPRKSFVINKKLVLRGDSFIKRYITGKIGIKEMFNHPKESNDEKNKLKYDTSPSRKTKNFSPINDNSKIFELTKLQTKEKKKENNLKKNIPKMLNIKNNNFEKNQFIMKSFSDGNYNLPNTKVMSHENFMREINETLNRRHNNKQFILTPYNKQKTSSNRLFESQLFKNKRFNNVVPKKRKKLLIIQ